ncbi:helix-turn-helix domain-containing protein [Thomasclavelia cocleata]|uniref:helix-turn-helix domain-containing protein n=1 Tax=Thomasclavelia cocleata TaxID=69824 RepID=UPI0024957D20|nr:helix-turn-helix transcriptional regulator [Thomasclavelia cocleata]
MEFNQKLRNLRKKNNMSVNELAQKIGLSDSSVRMYETGNRIPPADILIKLAKTFGVSSDYLLGIEPPNGRYSYSFTIDFSDNGGLYRDMIELIENGAYKSYCKKPYAFYEANEKINAIIEDSIDSLGHIYSELELLDVGYLKYDTSQLFDAFKNLLDELRDLKSASDDLTDTLELIDEKEIEKNINVDVDLMKDIIKDHIIHDVDLSKKTDEEIIELYNMFINSYVYNRIKGYDELFGNAKKDTNQSI